MTLSEFVTAALGCERERGEARNAQASPACVTTNSFPPISTVAARATTVGFAARTYSITALPKPLVGGVIVIHEFVFTTSQVQFVAVVRATVFVSALALCARLVCVSAYSQGVPAWVRVSTLSAICTVPVRLMMSKFSASA